jgi:hypothetical protein
MYVVLREHLEEGGLRRAVQQHVHRRPVRVSATAERNSVLPVSQCCQMAYFQTKNPNLGKFWKVLQWKMLVFLVPFCLFYGQMLYFVAKWYI